MRIPKAGLTLIEIIIALALLGVLVSFVVSSLASSFQITRENRKSVDATTTAQRILEDIRGQWSVRGAFNSGCATVTLTPPNSGFMTLSATQQNLTMTATTSGTVVTLTGSCGAIPATAPCVAPMKRVIVQAIDSADTTRTLARVALDVLCPVVNP